MLVTQVVLKNWRNFREVDICLRERTYLLGPNASGKSNFLDVFRFLKDIGKSQGGGLQKAVADRGGISKLRCLHARRPQIRIEVSVSESADDAIPAWRYILEFSSSGKVGHQTLISSEQVWESGKCLLERPDADDKSDRARLTQTNLEQIQANERFRDLAVYFGDITYLHLVPQLLRFGDRIGGYHLEDDPFGQGFLERVAKATQKIRSSRLHKIEKALELAVPQFKELRFEQDKASGRPHLSAMYTHHRPGAGWQREDQFSDGTLRLLGLLWSLLEGDSLLLLEEPELSLNDAIVKEIPLMLRQVQRESRKRRQILISTHSEALVSNPGIDARGVLLFEPTREGTKIRTANKDEEDLLKSGLSVSEVMLPKTWPPTAHQLSLW